MGEVGAWWSGDGVSWWWGEIADSVIVDSEIVNSGIVNSRIVE